MSDQERQRPSRIPEFASIAEEAEFWDTHDLTDYWDELRPIRVRVADDLSDGLTVRLARADREELERRANEHGVGADTLARLWLEERLREGAA